MLRIIDYSENTGSFNMRFDEQMLDNAIDTCSKDFFLRFYGWKPKCVSLGRNQSENNINIEYCKSKGIDIVRRPTGGRGLLHDNEITYSFVCNSELLKGGDSIISSYKEISSALIQGFGFFNIKLDFGAKKQKDASHDYCMLLATGADLCYRGKKLIGSAQCRKRGYILQHGSILYDYDKELLEKIFKEPADSSAVTSIKSIRPDLSKEKVIETLSIYFVSRFAG